MVFPLGLKSMSPCPQLESPDNPFLLSTPDIRLELHRQLCRLSIFHYLTVFLFVLLNYYLAIFERAARAPSPLPPFLRRSGPDYDCQVFFRFPGQSSFRVASLTPLVHPPQRRSFLSPQGEEASVFHPPFTESAGSSKPLGRGDKPS